MDINVSRRPFAGGLTREAAERLSASWKKSGTARCNLGRHNISLAPFTQRRGRSNIRTAAVVSCVPSSLCHATFEKRATTPESAPAPASVPPGHVSFTLALTSVNEEAIILRYVSNGRVWRTVTARLSPGCWLAANDPPSSFLPSFHDRPVPLACHHLLAE